MSRLFARFSLRHALRHPFLALLNVLSIAAGVSVFLSVRIANRSALASFEGGIDLTAGKAHLEIRGNLDEMRLPELAKIPGIAAATPLVEGIVPLANSRDFLRILGVDPFTAGPFRTYSLGDGSGGDMDLGTWLTRRDALALSSAFAKRNGISLGNTLEVDVGGRIIPLTVAFLLEPTDAAASADDRYAAMDIGWAQELLGLTGRLTSISLRLTDPRRPEPVIEALRPLFPSDVSIAAPTRRGRQVEAMLASFQLNLTALSLVSLLVGMFLIYNTVSAGVTRRRPEIGMLRALGVTRSEVRLLFLGEAAMCAVVGGTLGVLAAGPIASAMQGGLSEAVSSIYLLLRVNALAVSPADVALALALGLGAALAAAWGPAEDAARTDPARVLFAGSAMEAFAPAPPRRFVAGLCCLAAAGVSGWVALKTGPPALGFLSAFCVLAGFSLLVPWTTHAFALALGGRHSPLRTFPTLRIGVQNLGRSLHRNSVTIAALAAAIAMTVGVEVMIGSFRGSVDRWMEHTLTADIFIAPAANEQIGLVEFLPPEMLTWLRAQPEIAEVASFRELQVETDPAPFSLGVIEGNARGSLEFEGGDAENKRALWLLPGHVAVSESLAQKRRLQEGDTLEIPGPQGIVALEVVGIYRDYTRDQGVALIPRTTFEAFWKDPRVHSLSLTLRPGVDSAALERRFRDAFDSAGRFSVYRNAGLKQRVFEIFEQTFALTYALRGIAMFVAMTGVALSLAALVTERIREIGVLRSQGASRGQVGVIFIAESACAGFLAGVVGLCSGALLAVVLTWVVNKAFFGWTVDLVYPVAALLGAPLLAIPVSAMAGALPAWLASRVRPAAALRHE